MAPDPAASPTGDPNLMAYHFRCDGDITAYTVVVNRTPYDFEVIDDFSTTADVTTAGAVVPTESFGCEGTLPGNGVNCNGKADAHFDVSGTFDTSDPFCGGYAPGAKWPALPAPAAVVQLVVTDSTGAQDGPFNLNVTPACKHVKPLPKPKPKKHKKLKHHP